MERHAALLRKQRTVEKKVGEGRSKVEKAKAKVAEEEGRLAEVEAELAGVVEQIRVVREETEKREKARREEVARAREPRCMEIQEKRRKVVRKGRFFRAGRSLDVDKVIRLPGSLYRENEALCMRSLGGSVRSLGESGSCSDASDSKRDKNSVDAQKKLVTQEDSMDTPSW